MFCTSRNHIYLFSCLLPVGMLPPLLLQCGFWAGRRLNNIKINIFMFHSLNYSWIVSNLFTQRIKLIPVLLRVLYSNSVNWVNSQGYDWKEWRFWQFFGIFSLFTIFSEWVLIFNFPGFAMECAFDFVGCGWCMSWPMDDRSVLGMNDCHVLHSTRWNY